MSWVRPTAPAPETAAGLKPDSDQVRAASRRGSIPAALAAWSMAPANRRPAGGRRWAHETAKEPASPLTPSPESSDDPGTVVMTLADRPGSTRRAAVTVAGSND